MSNGSDKVEAEKPRVQPDEPAVMAVRASLAEGLHWLRENEPGARRGDVEGVHHLRTTTRRLRTTLTLFGDLIDSPDAAGLADELKWLAGLLGAVRDLDVLIERFRSAAEAEVDGRGESLAPLLAALGARHDAASAALQEALRGDRFGAIKARLAALLDQMQAAGAEGEPCRTALPALVRGVWKKLRKAGRALKADDPDDHFHEARKRAKRARYAAEAVVDALDPSAAADARRFARRARAVQDVLGAHQDAVIAAAEVRASAASHTDLGPFNFAAGQLLEREHRAANDTRSEFFHTWADLDRKKVLRWLKP